jgi:hypothetical protein
MSDILERKRWRPPFHCDKCERPVTHVFCDPVPLEALLAGEMPKTQLCREHAREYWGDLLKSMRSPPDEQGDAPDQRTG